MEGNHAPCAQHLHRINCPGLLLKTSNVQEYLPLRNLLAISEAIACSMGRLQVKLATALRRCV